MIQELGLKMFNLKDIFDPREAVYRTFLYAVC
jgi:hypothetical protein